jgi:uncharacterized protein YcbK (DUF882 family)
MSETAVEASEIIPLPTDPGMPPVVLSREEAVQLSRSFSRRNLLKYAVAVGVATPLPARARMREQGVFDAPAPGQGADDENPPSKGEGVLGQPLSFWEQPRRLRIYRQETREFVDAVYWEDGKFVPQGYWQLCAVLRDTQQGLMTRMDPAVLDVMRGVYGYYLQAGLTAPIVATSGFRTQKTNNSLLGEGAARNSMHLYGKAVDLRIPGVPSLDIARLGLYFRGGGVGLYQGRGFTHLDSGRFRFWRG